VIRSFLHTLLSARGECNDGFLLMLETPSDSLRSPLPGQTFMVNIPPSTGNSRAAEVLNDTFNRVIANQNVTSLSYTDPQLQAPLVRQQQVLSMTICCHREGK